MIDYCNMNARRLKRTGLEYLDNIDLKFRKKHTTAMMQFWGVLRMLIPVLWLSTIALQIGKALLPAGTANNAFPICRAIILSHRTGINPPNCIIAVVRFLQNFKSILSRYSNPVRLSLLAFILLLLERIFFLIAAYSLHTCKLIQIKYMTKLLYYYTGCTYKEECPWG